MKTTTKDVMLAVMEKYAEACEARPVWLGESDSQAETATHWNEAERLANQKRIDRYKDSGVISSAGAY